MQNQPEAAESRIDRKKEDTRQRILSAGMRLFLEQGLEATTMEQIAEDADIAKGTLYNYFPVKEAILDEYMKRRFQERGPEWIARVQVLPDTRARLGMVFGELLKGVQAQKAIFEKYIIYRMQLLVTFTYQEDSEKSGLYRVIREILDLGQKSGELRSDLPALMLEDLCEFAFIESARRLYLEPETCDLQAAAEESIDLFLHGAGTPK